MDYEPSLLIEADLREADTFPFGEVQARTSASPN